MNLAYFYRNHKQYTDYTHFVLQYIHLHTEQSPRHDEFPSNCHTKNTPNLNQININNHNATQ